MKKRFQDAVGVFRGLNRVISGVRDLQREEAVWWWRYSSIGKSIIDSSTFESRNLPDAYHMASCVVDRAKLMTAQIAIVSKALAAHLSSFQWPTMTRDSSVGAPTDSDLISIDSDQKSIQRAPITPMPLSAGEISDTHMNPRRLETAKERRVPSSRLGRIAGFGNLAVGLGLGAVSEWTKRQIGFTDSEATSSADSSLFLSEANLERIVDTLCRMRGAALKLGQMLSIQDESMVNKNIQRIFERVRQAADFMPARQMHKVLVEELGPDWSSLLASFDERPFAAASIGQVHRGVLHDGRQIAMKIQYPGVVNSIDADIDNLMSLLSRFNILPRGLYAGRAVEVAKRELRAECDYKREASYCKLFGSLLADDPVFQVPVVIDELSTTRVFTAEYMEGLVIDDCYSLPQDVRNWLGGQLLRLCIKELFVFRVMQTDPNWSNFLYNPNTGKVVLLDFGASRGYDKEFIDVYIQLIHCASEGDRDGIIRHSQELGFFTGYESKVMVQAHVDAVSILGEAFSSREPFDFGNQSTTSRINSLIPVMLEHRLTPPPDESYSIHRKMSGCFLLCSKLKAVVDCRPLLYDVWNSYQFGPSSEDVEELLAPYR